jgi:phage protein D
LVVAGALFAGALAVSASGSSESTTILNTEKIEGAIEQSSLDQRGQVADVSCPSGVHQKKDVVFSCTAVTKGGSTQFEVTQLDDSGQVHYEAK